MQLHVNPVNPSPRHISQVADCLRSGGIIVYPTDTVYGLGCDISQQKAIGRIARLKKLDPGKAQFSFICYDLGDLSRYAKSISTPLFRMLKKHLPGPYTFVLPASREVPKLLKAKKNSIGLRIPDNIIARSIVMELGNPILSTSLPGEQVEDFTDPETIYELFSKQVDLVVDGGIGGTIPSTVIDCTGEEPILLRQGLGAWPLAH